MLELGKSTFGEFLDSDERIGTSVLANRLTRLEADGVIVRARCEIDRRHTHYSITGLGMELIPTLYELAVWGLHASEHPEAPPGWLEAMSFDRDLVISLWREAVLSGSSFLNGPLSVTHRLGVGANLAAGTGPRKCDHALN